MQHFPINFLALFVATLAKFFLGWLWYSSLVFGKSWMQLAGCTPERMKASMGKIIPVDLIATFVMAFVLVHAVHYAGATSATQGAAVGFFNWLGFVFTVTLAAALYEKRPFKLFLINNTYQLLGLLIMGAIVAVWR